MSRDERKVFDMKKLLAVFISAAMLCAMVTMPAAAVFAGDQSDPAADRVNGYIPFTDTYTTGNKKMVKDLGTPRSDSSSRLGIKDAGTSLPDSYRSDGEEWSAYVRIKDQQQSSLCWAFAMTTAAEYSYAKEVFEDTGSVLPKTELSPGHLGQFHYNRVDDPLGNTSGDYNKIPTGSDWPLYGGNDIFGMQHWATWSGAAFEKKYRYNEINKHIKQAGNSYVWEWGNAVYPSDTAYDDVLTQQESVVLFHPVRETMKELIYDYGAITGSMEFNWREYMNLNYTDPNTNLQYEYDEDTHELYLIGRSYYNYNTTFSANHAVTLVGWDDDYPAAKFSHVIQSRVDEAVAKAKKRGKTQAEIDQIKAEVEQQCREETTPPGDGAWIVQNSWGNTVHDGGFLYVSYYSADFNGEIAGLYAFDMQPADTYRYNFQYDGNALSSDSSDRDASGRHLDYYTRRGTRASNVYRNTTGGAVEVKAVGYTTFTPDDQAYNVSVYTGLRDKNDPASGKFQGTTRITTSTRGCKTAVLDRPVYVAPGETFSIVFDFIEDSAFGIETTAASDYFIFESESEPGQSFFSKSKSSKWTDMNGYDACFRIKAFADPTRLNPQDISVAGVSGITSKTYTGSAVEQNVVLSYDGYRLIEGTDYTVSYSNNVNVGTAVMTIRGMGNFTGSMSYTFSITQKTITPAVVLSSTDLTYNKKAQAPSVTVMDGGRVLDASQYDIAYPGGRKDVGAYSIRVTLKGNYSGTGAATYRIVPKGTSISRLSAARKATNVKWKKQSDKMSKSVINGYQLQYSTDPSFRTGTKTVTVKGYKTTCKRLGGLQAKKKYYVRIRTYKSSGSGNCYSGWSKAKTVRTK